MATYIIRNVARNAYWALKKNAWTLTSNKDEATRFDGKWKTDMFMKGDISRNEIERVGAKKA